MASFAFVSEHVILTSLSLMIHCTPPPTPPLISPPSTITIISLPLPPTPLRPLPWHHESCSKTYNIRWAGLRVPITFTKWPCVHKSQWGTCASSHLLCRNRIFHLESSSLASPMMIWRHRINTAINNTTGLSCQLDSFTHFQILLFHRLIDSRFYRQVLHIRKPKHTPSHKSHQKTVFALPACLWTVRGNNAQKQCILTIIINTL